MRIKIKTDTKKLEKTLINCESLTGRKVNVGIPEGSDEAYIAAIHEWGVTIEVTPGMRGWFLKQGCPLSPRTTQIVIPERSFFRKGMQNEGEEIVKEYGVMIGRLLTTNQKPEQILDEFGQELASAIREYAIQLSSPPNSAFTIMQKGSTNPLVGLGESGMLDAIKHEVE